MTEPTITEAVEALRGLNSAVWRAHPKWAAFSPETGKASEVIASWDHAERGRVAEGGTPRDVSFTDFPVRTDDSLEPGEIAVSVPHVEYRPQRGGM